MPALPSEEIVTNQAVILDCLKQIADNKTPLSLTLRDRKTEEPYRSSIQSFNIKKRQIVLKQLLPSDWRKKITPSCKLEIKSYMNMGNIRFYGLLSALDDSESSPYCKLTLPKKMFRMQLRDYYRVSLTKISSSATLVIDEESTLQGTCRDISMSGAMITLPSITNPIEIGQTLDECSISIDDILELNFSGKIRSLHKTEEDILAGIQFLDLSPAQLKPISAALKKIERQNINT
jgi:c-di-GMP-binding flagellar brake protein YcgR